MSGKKAKKKKEKVVYYDDGRTVADMSNVSRRWSPSTRQTVRRKGRGREIWHTYWGAVRMMFGPMLAVIVVLIILYMILTVVFTFFG